MGALPMGFPGMHVCDLAHVPRCYFHLRPSWCTEQLVQSSPVLQIWGAGGELRLPIKTLDLLFSTPICSREHRQGNS